MLLFADIDENGNILGGSIYGLNIVPQRQFDHFFYITENPEDDVFDYINNYQVIDGQLVKKAVG